MNERQQSILVAHGGLVFLLGMAAGFPFAFEILGRLELWPIPGSVQMDMPGDVRGWRMAHLEGVLNGLLMIGVASGGEMSQDDDVQARIDKFRHDHALDKPLLVQYLGFIGPFNIKPDGHPWFGGSSQRLSLKLGAKSFSSCHVPPPKRIVALK